MAITRKIYFLGSALCIASMGVALILEHVLHLEPCPLCMLSRVVVIALGFIFIISSIHNPKKIGIKIYAVIGVVLSLMGIALNVRHIWLQHLPADKAPACGPGIDYLLQVFTPLEVLREILMGSGECVEIQGRFLGMTLPMWTLGLFIVLGALWLYSGLKKG